MKLQIETTVEIRERDILILDGEVFRVNAVAVDREPTGVELRQNGESMGLFHADEFAQMFKEADSITIHR